MNPGRIYPRGGVAPPLERKNVAKQKEEKHRKTKRRERRKEQKTTVGSDMNCRAVKLLVVEKEDEVMRSTLQHVVTKCFS